MCFPAAAGLLTGPNSITVLVVSMLVSWSGGQGLAYLGYLRQGRGDAGAAKRVLRYGLLLGTVGIALALAVADSVAPARPATLIFGLGQGVYLLGASVVMVLGADRLLLLVLAPGVLGGAAFLALGSPAGLAHASWAALAATPLLAILLGLWLTRGRVTADGPVFAGAELLRALPSAAFGFLAAALIALPIVPGAGDRPGEHTGALLAALPLSLSMGAAEWSLFWYRRRTQRHLRATGVLRRFARAARLALLTATAQYLAAAILLTAAVLTIAALTGLVRPQWSLVVPVGAYLILGASMFLALLLQTMGSWAVPLLACTATLAVELAWRGAGALAQLAASAGLMTLLAIHSAVALSRAARHAC